MSSRREFDSKTRKAALKRSMGRCEASGFLYGIPSVAVCGSPFSTAGLHFDHVIADSNGGEPTLENCLAVCEKCHRYKSDKFDTPRAAKIKRQIAKHIGSTKPRHTWPSRPMNAPRIDNTKYLNEDIEE